MKHGGPNTPPVRQPRTRALSVRTVRVSLRCAALQQRPVAPLVVVRSSLVGCVVPLRSGPLRFGCPVRYSRFAFGSSWPSRPSASPRVRAGGASRPGGSAAGPVPGSAAQPLRPRSAGGACGGSRLAGGQPHRDGGAPRPRPGGRIGFGGFPADQHNRGHGWPGGRWPLGPSPIRHRNGAATPGRHRTEPSTGRNGPRRRSRPNPRRCRNGLHSERILSQAQPHPGRRRRLPRRRRRQSFPRLRLHLAMGQTRWSP